VQDSESLREVLNPSRRLPSPLLLGALAGLWLVSACSANVAPPDDAKSAVVVPGVPVPGASEPEQDRAGKPANFAFTLKDMNGATVELASFKGRPVVVNFWATWCPPCKLEIPWFIEFKNKYSGQGLEILGVSIDDPADELQKFAVEYKMNYPVLLGLDQDKMLAAYDAEVSVPVTWFIKKDGMVQGRSIGINTKEFFENQIKALF
jgi:thiol-disulfide isomerase/thioredoxin